MATKTVVTGDRYMDISRKLHELERQLLQRGGYPHDPDMLEYALQRATEGLFWPDDSSQFQVTVRGATVEQSLKSLELDNEAALLEEARGWITTTPTNQLPPSYQAWVTTVRFQREIACEEAFDLLERRELYPANLEASCAFLEKNRALQQGGPIACLGPISRGQEIYALVFTGDRRRRFTRTIRLEPDFVFSPNVRILAREQIVTVP